MRQYYGRFSGEERSVFTIPIELADNDAVQIGSVGVTRELYMIATGLEGHGHGESGGLEPRAAFDRHFNGGAIIDADKKIAGAFQYVVNHHLVVSIFRDDDIVYYQVVFRFAADVAYAIAAGAPLAGGSFCPTAEGIRLGLGLVGHSRLSGNGNDRGRRSRCCSQRRGGD